MNINKVCLMGRLTADPALKVSQQSQVPVIRFTIAISRRMKKDETDFIDCVAFRQTANIISKYFKKGSLIIAFGSIQVDNWKDKEGKNQRSVRVIVDEVQFGESKKSNELSATVDRKEESVALSSADSSDIFSDVIDIETDDELPF